MSETVPPAPPAFDRAIAAMADAAMADADDSPAAPRLGLWTLLGVIVLACGQGLYPGTWLAWEGYVPAWNVAAPAALANVATWPDLWRGMGWGGLAPAQPLLLLGLAPELAVKWVLLSALALGALGTYAWLYPLWGDRSAGLGGIVWILLPMHLTAVYSWGSLGDVLVLALLPLALAGVRALATSGTQQGRLLGAAVAVVAVLWMWRAQAGMALAGTLLLSAYAGFVLRDKLALLAAVTAGAAGLLSLVSLFGVTGMPPVAFGEQFVTLYGLLRTGAAAGEPLQLGVIALSLAAMGICGLFIGNRDAGEEEQRFLLLATLGVLLLATIALSRAAPLWSISGADRLFTYPWQPLLVAGPLLAALAAAVPAFFAEMRHTPFWTASVLTLLIVAQPAIAPAHTQIRPPARPVAIVGSNDLAILAARVDVEATGDEAEGAASVPMSATLTLTWQVLRPWPFDDNLFFQALTETPEGSAQQVVAQLDLQPVADRPATTWARGEVFTGTYTLTLPAEAQAAAWDEGMDLVYHAGFYDWRNGARRAVTHGSTATSVGADDKLVLHEE